MKRFSSIGRREGEVAPVPHDLLDPLLAAFAAFIVEGNDILGSTAHVRHDEADPRISSPGCHATLATSRRVFADLSI
jgi:hypothetical protein